MNKLRILNHMGFYISWKLINMGVFGDSEIPVILNRFDVVDYLVSLLTDVNEETDSIITLVCEKDNPVEFYRTLNELAGEDNSDVFIQKRKWRAYLLKTIIDNISNDCLQGLLELMEFWMLMGKPNDCPQTFPNPGDEQSIQDYFTPSSYRLIVNKNQEWLAKEIAEIVSLESKIKGSSLS